MPKIFKVLKSSEALFLVISQENRLCFPVFVQRSLHRFSSEIFATHNFNSSLCYVSKEVASLPASVPASQAAASSSCTSAATDDTVITVREDLVREDINPNLPPSSTEVYQEITNSATGAPLHEVYRQKVMSIRTEATLMIVNAKSLFRSGIGRQISKMEYALVQFVPQQQCRG